jgi:hypothetical protein
MNRWRVGEDRGSKETDGCPLTDLYIYFGFPLARLKWRILLKSVRLPLHKQDDMTR